MYYSIYLNYNYGKFNYNTVIVSNMAVTILRYCNNNCIFGQCMEFQIIFLLV